MTVGELIKKAREASGKSLEKVCEALREDIAQGDDANKRYQKQWLSAIESDQRVKPLPDADIVRFARVFAAQGLTEVHLRDANVRVVNAARARGLFPEQVAAFDRSLPKDFQTIVHSAPFAVPGSCDPPALIKQITLRLKGSNGKRGVMIADMGGPSILPKSTSDAASEALIDLIESGMTCCFILPPSHTGSPLLEISETLQRDIELSIDSFRARLGANKSAKDRVITLRRTNSRADELLPEGIQTRHLLAVVGKPSIPIDVDVNAQRRWRQYLITAEIFGFNPELAGNRLNASVLYAPPATTAVDGPVGIGYEIAWRRALVWAEVIRAWTKNDYHGLDPSALKDHTMIQKTP